MMTKQSHQGGPTLPLTTEPATKINDTLRMPHKKRKIITCFNILSALVVLEATVLLLLGFFSGNLALKGLDFQAALLYHHHFDAGTPAHDDDVRNMEDLLAEQAEYALRARIKGEASETELTTDNVKEAGGKESNAVEGVDKAEGGKLDGYGLEDPIDNYYSRKHITKERLGIRVPLVVGGSDGSGTRAFVEILGRLGVPMLVDDAGTMDVHGKKILKGKGWPPLASAVLRAVRSSNYNFDDLPKTLQTMTVDELTHLRDDLVPRGERLIEKAVSKNMTNISKDISFGFKAPVTMLLVPILRQVLGPMKFLHVVRDGRDVAMSTNQSPVKKFYNDSYADGQVRLKKFTGDFEHVMGMQLWNDWNTGLLEYERTHNDGKTLDFLVMRTEDLLNPEKKFKSLIQLANFVGSPKTLEELCCLSRQAIGDMGKSSSSIGGVRGRFKDYLHHHSDSRSRLLIHAKGNSYRKQVQALLQSQRDSRRAVNTPIREQHRRLSGCNESQQQDRKTLHMNLGALLADRSSQQRQRSMKGGPSNGKIDSSGKNRFDRVDAIFGGEAASDTIGHRRLTEDMLLEKKPGKIDRAYRGMDLPWMGRNVLKDRRAAVLGKSHAKVDVKHAPHSGELAAMARAAFAKNMKGGVKASAGSGWKDRINSFGKKGEKAEDVVKRYGKWVELLKDKPEVSSKLHEEGAQGLMDFGYEPALRFQDIPDESDFRCDASVQCDDVEEKEAEAK